MIALSAHREILKIHTWKVSRVYKNDNTPRGKGAWQSPAQWTSHRRYCARRKGVEPQLEYLPIEKALEAIS